MTDNASPQVEIIEMSNLFLTTETPTSELAYKKKILIVWLLGLLLLVALISISDYAGIPVIKTILENTIPKIVLTYVYYICVGQSRKKRRNQSECTIADVGEAPEALTSTSPIGNNTPQRRRLYFLDNVKVFLTAVVVSHHVSCSFGACGFNTWPLIIGLQSPDEPEFSVFRLLISSFDLLNQGYFMSLFFFISSYFVPSSYSRRESWEFHYERAKRYLLPFFLETFLVWPISVVIAQLTVSVPIAYEPYPGPAWFLFWLVIFNIVYSTVVERREVPLVEIKMPKWVVREVVGGLLICGLCMGLVIVALLKSFLFFYMPITIGSLVCDVFFFILGIIAFHNRWLEQPIRNQLDTPVWLLRSLAIAEAIFICIVVHFEQTIVLGVFVAGLFCLDMSLVVLEYFQTHMDWQTHLSKYLADAAYGVYIFHPFVTTAFTSIFVLIYNASGVDEGIKFSAGTNSYHKVVGPDNGGVVLCIGWFLCNIFSHAVLWPLAHMLKKKTPLKHIL